MTERLRVLVVDDEAPARSAIASFIARRGDVVHQAADGAAALTMLGDEDFDIVLSDVRMPNMDGIALTRALRDRSDDAVVVLMSGYTTIDDVIAALREGTYDYLTKPVDPDQLLVVLGRVRERLGLRRRVRALTASVDAHEALVRLLAAGPTMEPVLETIRRAAATDLPVLVAGTHGRTAELVARAVHGLSSRAAWPLSSLDAATVPPGELDGMLFGAPGRGERGLVRNADRGTLVIEHLETLPPATQARLAQVLREQVLERPDGRGDDPVDVRLVAVLAEGAAARDAEKHVLPELYARLRGVEIEMPPPATSSAERPAVPRASDEALAATPVIVPPDRAGIMAAIATRVVHEIGDASEGLSNKLQRVLRGFARLSLPRISAPPDDPAGGGDPETGDLSSMSATLMEARQDAERLSQFVLDLRAFADSARGRAGSVDLLRVLEAAVLLARRRVGRRARLVAELQRLPQVRGDESRYTQVFLSLLLTAARAIPAGDAEHHQVEIRAFAGAAWVCVEIRDDGQGVPADALPRLFDPFYLPAPDNARVGLGMPLCNMIVTSFGGKMTVESDPAGGTWVRVLLPVASPRMSKVGT
jgi:signal transduction histidine kinase/DNA-binding response OmpR family regulator